jgi:hypothetical protein
MMSGQVGNPYHDPKTGKFTSGAGQNVSNSTLGQRIKGRAGLHVKAAAAFGGALAVAAGSALVHAAIQGASKPVRDYAEKKVGGAVNKLAPKIEKAANKTATKVMKAASAAAKAPAGQKMKTFHHGITAPSTSKASVKATQIPGTFPWKK